MSDFAITEEALLSLRERVKSYMGDKRYLHTLAVEKESAAIGKLFMPERVLELRAAALLHDITKVLSLEKQLKLCQAFDIIYRNSDILSPKLFHAKTASELLRRDFPEFATDDVVSAVRWHTTGRRGMTLFEGIVYLADYIEETRTFDDCIELRAFFWDAVHDGKKTLDAIYVSTMIKSFDLTIGNLVGEGAPIDSDTVDARNYFIEIYREKFNEL